MEQMTLRHWLETDEERLSTLADNPRVAENLRAAFPSPYSRQEAASFIRSCQEAEPGQSWMRAICWEGKLVGSVGVFRQEDVYCRCADIGYFLGEPYWGKGIMTQAVKQICAQVFEESDILRIQAEVFGWNAASCRLLEKAGFQREGVLRQRVWKNGVLADGILYALLREDMASS